MRDGKALLAASVIIACALSAADRASAQSAPPEEPPSRGPWVVDPPPPPPPPPPQYGLPLPPAPRTSKGLAGLLAAEVGGYGTHVDVGPSRTDGGGGALGRVLIVGHNGAFTFRAGARGLIGGGSGGFATRLAGDVSGGPALELDDEKHVRLFARLGLDLSTTKDDTLDASLFSVPSASAGMMFSFERFVLELGPRGGLALRSDFEPGAEYQGLRHHRRSVVRPDWGASLAMLSTFMTAHASAYRVEERAGLWHADGSMCGVAFSGGSAPAFFFCANGQLWKGEVRDALGVSREATAASLGLSIAIGVVEIKNGKDR